MSWEIREGDALDRLREMPDESVQCCVTSPPYYGLRDYGVPGQIGLESTLGDFVAALVAVFREVRRVLRSDGTLWLNLGDTYSGGGRNGKPGPQADVKHRGRTRGWVPPQAAGGSGLANKQLCGVPWRVALALQADDWMLRSDIIWAKPAPMPEPVTDRPTRSHEYIFLLAKSARYYYDHEAIREESVSDHPSGNGYRRPERLSYGVDDPRGQEAGWELSEWRNKRDVWTVGLRPFPEAHFATFPPKLVEPCILAGAPEGGVVLDPFAGAGTTGLVALRHDRSFIGIELNPAYAEMARERIRQDAPLLNMPAEAAA